MTQSVLKTGFAQTAIAASALAMMTVSATAGGDFNGPAPTLKGSYGHKVAHVPAPAPLPVFAPSWYVGLAGTIAPFTSGTISESGDELGTKSMSDLDGIMSGAISMGRYFNNGWRGEIELAFRPFQSVTNGTRTATTTRSNISNLQRFDAVGNFIDSVDTHHYNISVREKAEYAFQTGMVKAIYDFDNGSRFSPFLGAGAGLTLYTFKRSVETTTECDYSVNSNDPNAYLDPGPPVSRFCAPDPTPPVIPDTRDSSTSTSWGYSLAVMAGVAIDITENTKFDIGYQGTYTSGTVSAVFGGDNGLRNEVTIEDRFDHELRLGIRWDIH